MESRWYLKPGQTLENTNISDRGHALHVSATAWQKVKAHLDRNKLVAEALEQERAKKQKMKDDLETMTKNWSNCVLNTQRQKEEGKKRLAGELEDTKQRRYLEIRKEQEEKRHEYIAKVKRTLYYEKSYPKQLNGALLEAEAIYERGKQLEFKKIIQEHDQELERQYAEKVKQGAEDERQEKLEQKRADAKKKLELKEMFLKEIRDKEEFQKNYIAKKAKNEIMDNENAKIEIDRQTAITKEDNLQRRANMKKELTDYMKKDSEIKKQLQKEEHEVDEVIKVFEEAKHRIHCLRIEKDNEIKQQMIERRKAASLKAVAAKKAKDEEFAMILKKAQDEAEQIEEQRRQDKLEKIRQLRQDREDDRKQFLERQAKQRAAEKELQKWEMLNAHKKTEVMREYDEDIRKKKWEEKLQYRQELTEQIKEKETVDEEEEELVSKEHAYMDAKLQRQDKMFFDYAEELLEYARRTGRPTKPIENVVTKYKKDNHMKLEPSHYCEQYDNCPRRGKMVSTTPGKMLHDKRTDPTYNRCKCYKDKIVK